VANVRFDSTFTLKYARFDSTFTLKYARFDSTFTLKYSPVCNSTFTLKYARFDSTFTLKYARFVCHVDSTTHNFIFSFHVSSLSDGYHPASWFNTQASYYYCYQPEINSCSLKLWLPGEKAKYRSLLNNLNYLSNALTHILVVSNDGQYNLQLMININLRLDLLLLAGDIEENPGPGNMVLVSHWRR
jgi:hypothetical protein